MIIRALRVTLRVTLIVGVFIGLPLPSIGSESLSINDLNKLLSKDETTGLEAIIEKQIAFHRNHLVLDNHLSLPVRIFESQLRYKQYQARISKTRSNNGFYSSRKNELVVFKQKNFINTILHESQHFILRSGFQRPPKWINEGLSEYFENAFVDKEGLFVEVQLQKKKRLQKWLRADSLPELSSFLALDNSVWSKMNATSDYSSSTLSWGLIYFLMHTQEGRKLLSHTINTLNKDEYKTSVVVIDDYYDGGVNGLEKDFRLFIDTMPPKQEL